MCGGFIGPDQMPTHTPPAALTLYTELRFIKICSNSYFFMDSSLDRVKELSLLAFRCPKSAEQKKNQTIANRKKYINERTLNFNEQTSHYVEFESDRAIAQRDIYI